MINFAKSIVLIPAVVGLWLVGGSPAVAQLDAASAPKATAPKTEPVKAGAAAPDAFIVPGARPRTGPALMVPPGDGRNVEQVSQAVVVSSSESGAHIKVRFWDQTMVAYELEYRAGQRRADMVTARRDMAGLENLPPIKAREPYTVIRDGNRFSVERNNGEKAELVFSTFREACAIGPGADGQPAPSHDAFRVCHKSAPEQCATIERTRACYDGELRPVTVLLVQDTLWFVAERVNAPNHVARMMTGIAFRPAPAAR